MKDKVQKIREEVEKLKSQLLRGACSSQVTMETRCKEEAYDEVLAILNTMQEEPKFKVGNTIRYLEDGDMRTIIEIGEDYYKLNDCSILHFNAQDKWKLVEGPICAFCTNRYTNEDRKILCDRCEEECEYTQKKEPVSDIDFEQELYKAFGQVKDFTLGMQIAKRFYEMGKQHQEPVSEELEEASKKWLIPQLDKSYAAYGETKQMELTHFDGYAMLDAIEFGAQWQKQQDQSTIELAEDHAMLAGMEKMKEEMRAKAIDVEVKVDAGGYPYIPQMELYDYDNDVPLAKEGDKYKVVLIKEE